ncbi:MAG: glycosyltransferase family A protein [Balneolales bacterium]
MLVSVIIPTYNRAHLVKDAIDSVLKQTYQNFELLIVDDYSEDNTKEVVKSFKHQNIKYLLNNRSKGAQGARNTGLLASRGQWIAMLDSDDIWLPTKLEKQVAYIKITKNNVAGLSTGNAKYDFKNHKVIKYKIPQKRIHTAKDLLYKNYLSGFSTFIFNKEKALITGGFDERFPAMQDVDFYISMSKQGEIHSLFEVLAYIREENKDRITTNYQLKLLASTIFHEKYKDMIKDHLRLKNKAVSRLMVYGWKQNKLRQLRYLHWIFLGMFIDPLNLKWVIGHIIRP